MGIHDRDYARADRNAPRQGTRLLPSPARWSMTLWLIVINVAIFAIGLLLMRTGAGQTLVPGPVQFNSNVPIQVQRAPVLIGPIDPQNNRAPLFDPATRQLIGAQQFYTMTLDQAWGHFSTAKGFLSLEVWRFITFQFLHSGWTHIFLNMLGLWVFGPDVEAFLGRRRYLALYLTCGAFGAVAFLLLNFLGNTLGQQYRIPGLLFDDVTTPLVGASAGIFGIILAAAYVAPQRMLYILGIIPMRQRPAAYLLIAIAAVQLILGSNNAGGEAAHLGGGLAGYFFIRRMYLLRDFFDVLGPEKPSKAKAPTGKPPPAPPDPHAVEVDRILAKITATGQASLTDAERETLARAAGTSNQPGTKGQA